MQLRVSGSIPPISTHLKPRVSVGNPGFVCVSGAPLWRDASLGAQSVTLNVPDGRSALA